MAPLGGDREDDLRATAVVADHGGALAELLDEARALIDELEDRGVALARLAVSPASYASIAEAKRDELARGERLYVLGLALVTCDDLDVADPAPGPTGDPADPAPAPAGDPADPAPAPAGDSVEDRP